MKKNIFLSAILLLIFYSSNAQSWDWVNNINNGAKNIGTCIGTDNQNNIYVKGSTSYSTGGGGGYYYAMFWKFDQSGNMLWADTINIGGKTVTDTNGNTYIASGKIAKYNNAGQQIWMVTVAPIGCTYLNIALHPLGGAVVVGNILIGNDTKSVISRYDENGNCLWTRTGDFPSGGSIPNAITCDSVGNTYWVGQNVSTDSITIIGFLAKIDNTGNLLSTKTIPNVPTDVAISSDFSIYVVGQFSSDPIIINNVTYQFNSKTYYFIKYDQSGNVLWYKIITGILGNNVIATDKKGNVYLTIDYTSLNVDNINLNSTYSNSEGIAVMKVDSTGNILWIENSVTISPGSNYPNDIIVNSADEVLITGAMSGTHSFGAYTLTQSSMYTDLLVAKIGLGITTNITSPKPIPLKEFNVFPNPGQGMFQISYKASETEEIQINVFNNSGMKVFSEVITNPQKEFTKNINLSKEAKGTYYIELITNGKKSVEKIVLN